MWIDDGDYDFVEGMTWAQWVASEYSNDNSFVFEVVDDEIHVTKSNGVYSIKISGADLVKPTDIIVAEEYYVTVKIS